VVFSQAREISLITMKTLGLHGSSFTDIIPSKYQTEIHINPSGKTEINATDGRVFFPISPNIRTFHTLSNLSQFIIDNFGSIEIFYDKEMKIGARGSYVLHGITFFEDENLGYRFRVIDPILAYTAGIKGTVEVSGEMLCLDPDGDCSTDYASYLESEVNLMLPSELPLCGKYINVCLSCTSFFNKVPFPPWARHGSNIEFTTYSALPETSMATGGYIYVPPSDGIPYWDSWPLPYARAIGQNKVESAVWCFGSWDCIEYRAEAVCGYGTVTDPDVKGTRYTGNGPQNLYFCG